MFRNLPPITKNLLIINVICFFADYVFGRYGIDFSHIFGLHYLTASEFGFWQPITYMFMHANFSHLFFNMFALWMFGRGLEQEMGTKRFLLYYFVCGVGAALVQMAMAEIDLARFAEFSPAYYRYLYTPTVGASGAVFGLLLAFGMLHPNAVIMLIFPPIPMKAKWFVMIYGLVELLYGVSGSMDNIAHFAHLGGMFWGWLLLLWWRYRDRKRNYYY